MDPVGGDKPLPGSIASILIRLVSAGWIPLRLMGPLLGYSHHNAVYARQKSKNPIETFKVGGTYRVYEHAVVAALEGVEDKDREASQAILSYYRRLKREKEQENEHE